MRFSAPRSASPSPVRGRIRSSSTFGVPDDSDSEDYLSELESSFDADSDYDAASIASSSSPSGSSYDLVADLGKISLRPRHIARTPLEERQLEETVASIRLRTRYHDPYEEWERSTRKDAFRTARREYSTVQAQLHAQQEQLRAEEERRRAAQVGKQAQDVQANVERQRRLLLESEKKMKEEWDARNRQLWERIEAVIKMEEDKVAKKLEEERKAKEEEERKKKEAELKRRLEEEKKQQEEAAKRKAEEEKKKAEEEKAKQEKEEEEKRKQAEEERQRREDETKQLREKLHFMTSREEWKASRSDLMASPFFRLKTGPMRLVKSQREVKSEWSRLRRQIVPKIGQLTNDAQSIAQISQQLVEILRPSRGPPHPEAIYLSLCSSLAKAILLQAETEVTAKKVSAGPLAQVAFNLLDTLDAFPVIFFAKLVQRCGGWAIPVVIPREDADGTTWPSREAYFKACGWRKSSTGEGLESTEEYSNRVSAMMRVYFHILKIRPVNKPLERPYHVSRYWAWFARMLNDTELLKAAVAPELLYSTPSDPRFKVFNLTFCLPAALDVMGLQAKDIWGQQWIKVLALVHQGVTTGYENGKLIGGDSAEGAAARTRVVVALENIVNGVESADS
ncbi:hypothetical protein CVT26_010009 [Gymnopilus dilepis]|uniref:mRNA export factor GLE1 n=1 Tax=Gymnopilus dilepis TaxID=231916 RepID=A0A409VKY4_9AGAR|nr:hypothetical protein CVT26_010009 [Gymnopilus dilepis]